MLHDVLRSPAPLGLFFFADMLAIGMGVRKDTDQVAKLYKLAASRKRLRRWMSDLELN
jgi:TPR repeat protein